MTADIILCYHKCKTEMEADNKINGLILGCTSDSTCFEIFNLDHGTYMFIHIYSKNKKMLRCSTENCRFCKITLSNNY